MQQFSFDFKDPVYELHGWKVGMQVITFENTYGLDPDKTTVMTAGDTNVIKAQGLRWAGGQEKCDGWAELGAAKSEQGVTLRVSARHRNKIRCTKVIINGLPRGRVIGARWAETDIPDDGLILGHPRGLPAPLMFIKVGERDHLYFRSLDDRVREKRFAVCPAEDGVTVELIHEDAGHEMTNETEAPPWEIGRCADPREIVHRQIEHIEASFGLQRWESRPDVPAWAREIAFCASIHCMHWTGYVFNSYDDALAVLRWVTQRIEGKRVFAFLPGWEGRYYWQYGEYWPHERLGGEEGFRRLVEGAHELGVRVCPMFGANCANRGLANFEQWGHNSYLRSAGGWIQQGNKPDWDTARAHDTGWQAWLNPGAPGWGSRLLEQSARVVERFGVDAVFYDTHGAWTNDPNFAVYEGLVRLRDRLKERFPDLLVTGESWYSPLGAVTPVTHSGIPEQFEEIFTKYNRRWEHLSLGDPSRGSTGVHELGTRPWRMPELRKDLWPTVTFVDGTIEKAEGRVLEVIRLAKEYVERFLS